MFDMAKKVIDYSSRSVKFWDEVEKKNIIPDRTSQSLRTAWRKFSKYGEENFIIEALKDSKIKFSHQFESVPYLYSYHQPKVVAQAQFDIDENLKEPNVQPEKEFENEPEEEFEYKSEKEAEIESEKEDEQEQEYEKDIEIEPEKEHKQEPEKALNMDIDSERGSDDPEREEDEECEFLLAVEDLQSALAFNATDDTTYSLKAPRLNKAARLSSLYDETEAVIWNNEGTTMHTLSETSEGFRRINSINQEEMHEHLTKKCKLRITRNLNTNELKVQKVPVEKSKDQFFEELSVILRDLAKEYDKDMDEMHMLFMEVSCDLGELKNMLKGMKAPKWNMLEDIAIQSEPGSMEFQHVSQFKGDKIINQRSKFLELSKNKKNHL